MGDPTAGSSTVAPRLPGPRRQSGPTTSLNPVAAYTKPHQNDTPRGAWLFFVISAQDTRHNAHQPDSDEAVTLPLIVDIDPTLFDHGAGRAANIARPATPLATCADQCTVTNHRPDRETLPGLLASFPEWICSIGQTRRRRRDGSILVPEKHNNGSERQASRRRQQQLLLLATN